MPESSIIAVLRKRRYIIPLNMGIAEAMPLK